jgi:hypothetical protein
MPLNWFRIDISKNQESKRLDSELIKGFIRFYYQHNSPSNLVLYQQNFDDGDSSKFFISLPNECLEEFLITFDHFSLTRLDSQNTVNLVPIVGRGI